jgi:glycosyltransferase involved in cell wall biosynthesis
VIPKVAVVSPVFNGARWIGRTIESVLNQTALVSGRADIDYVIVDGGSTDESVGEVLRVAGDHVRLVSEPDRGMYDALAKGWRLNSGSATVCAYLNAGDIWHESALDVVLDVFESTPASWVCGYHVIYNREAQITSARLPFRYRKSLIQAGFYGTWLPHVQQESTFWSGDLMERVDLDDLRRFRLAGDYFLWMSFAEAAELYVVGAILGGFRTHGGHLSSALPEYREEVRSLCRSPKPTECMRALADMGLWHAPDRVKKRFNRRQLLRYDHEYNDWR